ncbi:MAG: hypothetical protein IKU52_08180 [Clostridia bacterium]|nr:hypothetical protein [Clostridia bacterium]
MEYIIKKLNSLDWSRAEIAPIDKHPWRKDYTPEAYAQLLVVNDTLYIKMTCHEKNPKAIYTEFYEEVWLDSTMEAFFGYEKGGCYINCEMNSIGNSLIGVGPGRDDRKRIDEFCPIPKVTAEKEEDKWSVTAEFPLDSLKAVFSQASLDVGTVLYGNLYKVGEHTHTPHYGMWSEITWDIPDFHRPEFFGKFVIKGE